VSVPVPFFHAGERAEEAAWLAALNAATDAFEVRPGRDMRAEDLARTEVAIVANPDPADLARLARLRWVQSLWAGVERLVGELQGVGIVRLVDPQLGRTMAEAVLAWVLYLHRDMPRYAAQQRARIWRPHEPVPASGRTVGILGLGHLGRCAAERLRANGFAVAGWSRTPKEAMAFETYAGAQGLADLLGRADIAVVLLPLTADTRGLLDAARLGQMKPGGCLVNFARGPIVDTDALVAALDAGRLGHAVLDVFATEPLPPGDPLWSHDRITVLPHISAPTHMTTAAGIVAANIAEFLKDGTIPETVDRGRGY
jgi:glyoxylate/hydroxypyruvate reductase